MFSQAKMEKVKDLALKVHKSGIRNRNAIKGEMDGLSDWSLSLIEASRDAVKHLCWLFLLQRRSFSQVVMCWLLFIISQWLKMSWASQVAQLVKNLPAMQETLV